MILRLISTSLKFGANFGKGTEPGKCLAFFIIARLGVLHSFLRESCIDVDKTIKKIANLEYTLSNDICLELEPNF